MSDKRDLFGDELSENNARDFESLLNQSLLGSNKRLKVGDALRGEILTLGKEEAFVGTGTPTDGIILISDLKDDQGNNPYKVGDFLDVVVTRIKDGEIRLSRKNSKKAVGDIDSLEDAHDMELPVEGRVLEANKGGFRIQIMGHQAFCPISQIDLAFVKDPAPYVGKKFEFLITKLEEGARDIVVSRKKLLELQKAELEGEFLEKTEPGEILEGEVSRLENFGAFVKLQNGPIEGLIHVSELTWGRVKHPSEVIQVGTKVRVKVLKIEEVDSHLKISLSLKQGGGESDPWLLIEQNFPVGKVLEGIVDKKETFGYFVNLAPGVTGLLHVSKWKDSVDGQQYEGKKKGDKIKVQIDQLSTADRKISLGLPQEGVDDSWKAHSGSSKGFGTMADALAKLATNKTTKKT